MASAQSPPEATETPSISSGVPVPTKRGLLRPNAAEDDGSLAWHLSRSC